MCQRSIKTRNKYRPKKGLKTKFLTPQCHPFVDAACCLIPKEKKEEKERREGKKKRRERKKKKNTKKE